MENKNPRDGYRHPPHVVWFPDNVSKGTVHPLCNSRCSVAVPYFLLLLRGEKLWNQGEVRKMKKALNFLLILTFALTLLVPLTGVHIHKSASLLFLLLCVVHAALHWRKMDARRGVVLGLIFASFLTGVIGLIFEEIPIILALHKVMSITVVFFLAIHIFVFISKIFPRAKKDKSSGG